MSVLRSIESKIESLFEGVFGRAFRSHVQPVELARKLAKEMDDHKSVSVSRVYVPNEYTVYLSPGDRRQFADYEDALREELQDYLAEHARRERYVLLTPPLVQLDTDADLDVGVFGIATRLVRGGRTAIPADAPPAQQEQGATMVYRPAEPARAPVPEPELEPEPLPAVERSFLEVAGTRHELGAKTLVIGRSRDVDIQVSDPNVSRRHAEVRPTANGYVVVDLDSTNGIELAGRRVKQLELEDGMEFKLGSTDVTFTKELD